MVPCVVSQQFAAVSKILERRRIRCRELGAPARNQIQFCQPLTLVARRDQVRSTIQLINNFEDALLQLFWRNALCEQPPDSEMSLGTRCLRDQGVGSFLHAVVEKPIGIFRANDKACSDRLPKLAVHLLDRVLRNHLQ